MDEWGEAFGRASAEILRSVIKVHLTRPIRRSFGNVANSWTLRSVKRTQQAKSMYLIRLQDFTSWITAASVMFEQWPR